MNRPMPQILCAGEALTDMVRIGEQQWHSVVGGSTWNVARSLARLAHSETSPTSPAFHTAFAGAISQDVLGDALYHASEAAQLDLRFIQRVAKSPLLAMVTHTAPPDYFFIGDDSADLYFDAQQLPPGWQQSLAWAHFGGISLARPPLSQHLIAMARSLKQAGVRISYDPNFRKLMDPHYDATLHTMSALANVIKVSDEDLRGLYRCADADTALVQLRQANPHAIILYTYGEGGASLYLGDTVCHAQPPQIELIDSVGAGDASIAGLIYSLYRHPDRSAQAHLHFAVACGAAACLAAGAQAPGLEQVHALYQQLQSTFTVRG